jgi:hypothetical protein
MSMRIQALRGPDRLTDSARSEWRLVVIGLVALLLAFAVLVTLATVNAPSTGGADHGGRAFTSRNAGVVKVGGDGQYRYHPLP